MPSFVHDETSEDSFQLTSSKRSHLDTGNYLTITQTSQVWTFTAAQYNGTLIYALDTTNAQLFLNGQAFQGYLLNDNSSAGLGFKTLPAGRYYLGSLYNGSFSTSSPTASGFVEIATLSMPGASFVGNVPLGVGGEAGSWKSIGFTITGSPSLYIETEGTGGKFMVMTDSQFQSFSSVYAAGFHGGSYSFVYTQGQNSGGPATEIEGDVSLPAGHYDLVWLNDTNSWQGGAANIWGYAAATSGGLSATGGASNGAGSGGGTGGGGTGGGGSTNAAAALVVQSGVQGVLRWTDPTFSTPLVQQVSAGQVGQAQAILDVVHEAQATSSVATLAYEFFTGKVPSAGGMDYLVSPTGPNPNNLNSAYYQSFSLENRYINFAVNLGKAGEGAAAFQAKYGALSLFEATRTAYATIFGEAPSDTKLHAILDPTTVLNGQTFTRSSYFAYYGLDGPNGIGTKAAMVGYLLAEAVKADLGVYAKVNDAFLTDVATHGAGFGVDIVGAYYQSGFVFHPG